MLDERLKDQNNGQPWIDCNMRRHPRPHHWRPDFQTRDDSNRIVAWFWKCERCPVASRTTKSVMPHPFLFNAPVTGGPAAQPKRYAS